MPFFKVKVHLNSADATWVERLVYDINHAHPQSPPGAQARGPGGSGDTEFEVLDFSTSGHFWFKSKLEDSLLKASNHLNLQSLTLLQEQVNAIRKVVEKSEMDGSPNI